MGQTTGQTAGTIVGELTAFIDAAVVEAGGGTSPHEPGHRVPFHWPPHPVSADFHVLSSDWSGSASFDAHGETFDVIVARTAMGVFGRCEKFWNEARGETEEEMLARLKEGCEPVFKRQFAIGRTIGREGRYDGPIESLPPADLVKLLYCRDRDVAHEAHTVIETCASSGVFSDALVEILCDRRHPARRIAQWCVLDMFEDLQAFYPDAKEQERAVRAVRELIWSAEDDFARTVYKAGVVLGGHVCTEAAADALLACVEAPSRIGRRSAIHAVFHLNEWLPGRKGQILTKLRNAATNDPEPLLREFAKCMARDIESGANEHITEPIFPDEP
ncbi:MAG: hypothetical protein IH945_01870 [Armatimonadetes bacterium]|nr:hypothetical protein [Armatimonadota bacterium]